MAQQQIETVNIDGVEYKADQLNDNAKAQINNIRIADAEVTRLKSQLAMIQTARAVYMQTLQAELKNQSTEEA